MKKEFVDYLYDLRSLLQSEIDKLVEIDGYPKDGRCQGCGDVTKEKLKVFRERILSVNKTIEKYFETHTKNI